MNFKSTSPDVGSDLRGGSSNPSVSERLAQQADSALDGASRAVAGTARSLQESFEGLRESVPGAVGRTAARAEDMARRGIDRARSAADTARSRAYDLSDTTVHRIREEPLKAMMIAAAVGATATLIAQRLLRS